MDITHITDILLSLSATFAFINYRFLKLPKSIGAMCIARFIAVGGPISFLRHLFNCQYTDHSVKILVWSGLGGGMSVALALTLLQGLERDLFLMMTYVVVVFPLLCKVSLLVAWQNTWVTEASILQRGRCRDMISQDRMEHQSG